ncbi:hypothetical protein Acid7E03_41710 [Acidisoma sp. 7E03]
MTARRKQVEFDPEHHLSQAELDAIRGPFVTRPCENAPVTDWLRWAREVDADAPLARRILEAFIDHGRRS